MHCLRNRGILTGLVLLTAAVPFLVFARHGASASRPREIVSEAVGQQRVMSSVAWDTVFRIGGSAGDTALWTPRIIAARGLLYVFDSGDRRLKAFDDRGKPLWTFGRAGQGPGEFENVVD